MLSIQSQYFFDQSCFFQNAVTDGLEGAEICPGVDDANEISDSIFVGMRFGYFLLKLFGSSCAAYFAIVGGVPRPNGAIGATLYFSWTVCIQSQVLLTLIELFLKVLKLSSIQDQSKCMLRVNGQHGYLNLISPVLLLHPDIVSSLCLLSFLVMTAAAGSRFTFFKCLENNASNLDNYFRRFGIASRMLPFSALFIGIGWWIITLGFLYSIIFFFAPIFAIYGAVYCTFGWCNLLCCCCPQDVLFAFEKSYVRWVYELNDQIVSDGGSSTGYKYFVLTLYFTIGILGISQCVVMGELAAFFSYNSENSTGDFGAFLKFLVENIYNFSDLHFDIDFTLNLAVELPSLIGLLQSLSTNSIAELSRGIKICGTLNFICTVLKLVVTVTSNILEYSQLFGLERSVGVLFCLSAKSLSPSYLSQWQPNMHSPELEIEFKDTPPHRQVIDRADAESGNKNTQHANPLRELVCTV